MKTTAKKISSSASARTATVRKTARLFTNGASQAVRLPKEFRMQGTEVRIWREGERVVMEPVASKSESLAEVMERFYALAPTGLYIERNQPPMQERDWSGVFEPASPMYYKSPAKPARKPRSKR